MNLQKLLAALCGASLLLGVIPAYAADAVPALSFPVECEIGTTCMVQNYFDHDPGPAAKDYRCGFLSYDGHDGTDIRLVNLAAMSRGFRVLAAAEGIVRAVRDGMQDIDTRHIGRAAIRGREAGNSVVIVHGNGWETQYSHMRKGSVLVRPGENVRRGQPLGLIGMSGWAEFPHLHLSVRHNGTTLDPFVGTAAHAQCGPGEEPLWDAKALAALDYAPGGVLEAGFSGAAPTLEQIRDAGAPLAAATAPALVFWIRTYGMRTGDEEHIRIVAPDGRALAESRSTLPGNKAEWLTFAGRKRREAQWPPGTYRGEYTVTRIGKNGRQTFISLGREVRISQ